MSGISKFNNFAGFIVNIDSAVIKSIKPCLTKLKVNGNRVSKPHAPTEADEKKLMEEYMAPGVEWIQYRESKE